MNVFFSFRLFFSPGLFPLFIFLCFFLLFPHHLSLCLSACLSVCLPRCPFLLFVYFFSLICLYVLSSFYTFLCLFVRPFRRQPVHSCAAHLAASTGAPLTNHLMDLTHSTGRGRTTPRRLQQYTRKPFPPPLTPFLIYAREPSFCSSFICSPSSYSSFFVLTSPLSSFFPDKFVFFPSFQPLLS